VTYEKEELLLQVENEFAIILLLGKVNNVSSTVGTRNICNTQ